VGKWASKINPSVWNGCRDSCHCTKASRVFTHVTCTGVFATAGTVQYAASLVLSVISWIVRRPIMDGLLGEFFTGSFASLFHCRPTVHLIISDFLYVLMQHMNSAVMQEEDLI